MYNHSYSDNNYTDTRRNNIIMIMHSLYQQTVRMYTHVEYSSLNGPVHTIKYFSLFI